MVFFVFVEEDVVECFDIKLGDKLIFNVGSEIVEIEVISLCKVDW